VLDCIEVPGDQHTAVDISDKLKKRLVYWQLGEGSGTQDDPFKTKIVAATSDNGANMVNALSLSANLAIQTVIGCVSHTIHLCVDRGFQTQRASHMLALVRRVVEHFNRSSSSGYKLRQAQLQTGIKECDVLGLVQDVKTRWTAAYHMMERMVLLYDLYVHRVLSSSKKLEIRKHALSPETMWQMKELAQALKPMCLAMQAMGRWRVILFHLLS
jgi:hypothetical protein